MQLLKITPLPNICTKEASAKRKGTKKLGIESHDLEEKPSLKMLTVQTIQMVLLLVVAAVVAQYW